VRLACLRKEADEMATPKSRSSSPLAVGDRAPAFEDLLGVDGRRWSLSSFDDAGLVVVVFTGNGCPTAKSCEDRFMSFQEAYRGRGVQLVAINCNNPYLSPPDTYPEMVRRAREEAFNFPYLKDEDGGTARAYGAVCTPQVFLLDQQRLLAYRGRWDDARVATRVKRHDLQQAVDDVLANRAVEVPETEAFGCSIVW
jgi:peroxiredoxin